MAAAADIAMSKMQSFIDTCSSEQIGSLMHALQATVEKNAGGGANNAASIMSVKAGVAAKRNGKKYRNKKAKLARGDGGPKRPLNSWMAFRKYYNGSLAPHTQKAISKVLTIMWRADPFEAKWAMLAKAYSVVRGSREKEDAPLDDFLGLCAPLIGVIPPGQYQQVMGWQLNPPNQDDKEKVPNVVRVFVPEFPQALTTTTLSVDDLVRHCHEAGFIKDGGQETAGHNNTGSLTMAVQPTNTSLQEAGGATETQTGVATTGNEQVTALAPLSPTDVAFEGAIRDALAEVSVEATALADATVALSDLHTEWPHNNAFDPTAGVEFTFDPNAGEDRWAATELTTTTVTDLEWDEFIEYHG